MKKSIITIAAVIIVLLMQVSTANAKPCVDECGIKPSPAPVSVRRLMAESKPVIEDDDEVISKEDVLWWGFPKEPEIHWCTPERCQE